MLQLISNKDTIASGKGGPRVLRLDNIPTPAPLLAMQSGGGSALWRRRKSLGNTSGTPKLVAPAMWFQQQTVSESLGDRHTFLSKTYQVFERLGAGSTSTVLRAKRRVDGRPVALKILRSTDSELLRTARREFELLKRLQHPHIIKAYDFHEFGTQDVTTLELFHGRTLEVAVSNVPQGRMEESTVCVLGAALFGALAYLHVRRIVHRDVSAGNVLLSEKLDDLRLSDFNVAFDLKAGGEETVPLTPTGTKLYAAPEVISGESPLQPSDVWSAGLCLYLMLSGELPQRRDRECNVALSVAAQEKVSLRGKRLRHTSDFCKSVLRDSLEINTAARPTAQCLLESAWFVDNQADLP